MRVIVGVDCRQTQGRLFARGVAPKPTSMTLPPPLRNAVAAIRQSLQPFSWSKLLTLGQLWTISALGLSNGLLLLGLVFTRWTQRARALADSRGLWIPIVVYWVLLAASIVNSPIARDTLDGSSDLLNLAPALLAVVALDRARSLRLALYGFVAVAVVHAGHGMLQVAQGAGDLETRITAAFSHYMTFAGVSTLALAVLLAWMIYAGGWRRWWGWAALVLISVSLMYALTRNAWIAVGAVLLLAALLNRRRWLAWLLPAALLAAALAPVHVVARAWTIGDLSDVSTYDRLCMLDAGLVMVKERPLLGHGPGTIDHIYPRYAHPTALRQRTPHLHNAYASLAVEQGVPSVLALLTLVGWAAFLSLRGLSRGHPGHRDLHAAALFGIVAFLVACVFEDYWADTEVQRVLLMLVAVPWCLRQPAPPPSERSRSSRPPDTISPTPV